jgi:hypothetical protein
VAPPASAAGPRYAAPTGTADQDCRTPATACDVVTAFSGTGADGEVVLLPGTYTLGQTLSRSQPRVFVHGVAGAPRPVLVSTAATALSLSGTGSEVADLAIRHSGGQYALNLFTTGTTVERVDVRTSGTGVACSPGVSGVVRDSLCVSTGAGGIALDDSYGGAAGALVLRGVTAVATGAGSIGLRAQASGSNTDIDVDGRNVIASGVGADVRSSEFGTNSESDVVLQSSNYASTVQLDGGFVTTAGSGSNQRAEPVFADGDFHQAPGSPTVDAGTLDPLVGATDLDGQPRAIGAVDIGADELVPDTTPPDTLLVSGPRRKLRKRAARFVFGATEPATYTCRLDRGRSRTCTAPYRVEVKRWGRHRMVVTATDASGNADPTPLTVRWKAKKRGHRR